MELIGYTAERYNHDGASDRNSFEQGPVERPHAPHTDADNTPKRTALTYPRSIVIAVGDDVCTEKVLKYAARYVCKGQDRVTLVHVNKAGSAAGKAGEAALMEKAKATLCKTGKVKLDNVSVAMLKQCKNVGQALVEHCKSGSYDILVIGSRGAPAKPKSKLRALLGDSSTSVSAYCVQHLQKPAVVMTKPPPTVVVVKPPEGHDWA